MRSLSAVPLLLLLVGCGGGPYKIAPVSGRVTLNGQPLPNAAITFQPTASQGKMNSGPASGAYTDSDGRYTLKLIGSDTQGAVVGKHFVRINLIPPDSSTDDRQKKFKQLPAKYHSRSKLEFDVPDGGTQTADFPLTSP